jgi:hypothetical protein
MTDDTICVEYRPESRDLPNGSTHYDDPERVELVDWERDPGGRYSGRVIVGSTGDGLDVAVFVATKRVRTRPRDCDTGAYRRYAGRLTALNGRNM